LSLRYPLNPMCLMNLQFLKNRVFHLNHLNRLLLTFHLTRLSLMFRLSP
jgi:hypothetical protein